MPLLFLALLSYFGLFGATIVVPQVPLCSFDHCPNVSRVGMGTLHVGQMHGDMTNVTKINLWIRSALAQGITLFDLADIYPCKTWPVSTFGTSLRLIVTP